MKLIPLVALSALAFPASLAFAAGNDVVVGMSLEPPHLDPTGAAAGAIDQVLYANVYEGLTRFASDGSVVPGLAESWEISEDGTSYLFHLRKDVTFHDGSTMDAEDVKFSLDRARAEDSTNAQKALFKGIVSVEVVDPTTVRVTLSDADSALLFNLAWGDAVIIAPENTDNLKDMPVGTGPFKFDRWVKGDRIELSRYDAYWGEPAALDGATFRFISDPTAAFAAMMSEDLDMYPTFPAPENLPQFEADPRFTVLEGSTEGETILAINNKKPPFDNLKIRKAIAHAIDREAIIDGAMFGYGTPIGSHFAPHNPAYVDLTGNSAYDPDMARQLLTEAGFQDGFSATLKLPPPSYARRGGEIIASQLRDVGIEVEIVNLEWAQWLEQVFRGNDFDMSIVSHTEPMDIGIYARPDYYFQYENDAFNKLIEELTAETDEAKRTEILGEAQRVLSNDYVNGFLFQLANASVVNAELQGVWKNVPTQAIDLTGVSWTK